MGMEIVGEQFIDHGNSKECTEPFIPAYEVLSSGIVRLFVCKWMGGQMVLDHTDIASAHTLFTLSQRLREIALEASAIPGAWPPLRVPCKVH